MKIDLLSGQILKYATNYKDQGKGYAGKVIKDDLKIDRFAPTPAKLTWEAEDGALYYTVKVSKNPDLSGAQKFLTFTNEQSIEDLFMGTKYYYQVIAQFENKTVKSQIFSFETSYLPRTIDVEGISNTRDAGGYYTVDGTQRIRQGMVYRGGKIEDGTEAGKAKLLNYYGIKTDLDLRAEATASPLGSTVNFVNVSGPYYAGTGTEGTGINSLADSSKGPWKGTYRDALLAEIRTFTNPENYPIYVHCSLGRDRTGTIVFLINALCGVGEMDLFMDYEASFFSRLGRADDQTPGHMSKTVFQGLYNYIRIKAPKKSLAEATELFMLEIGITQEEIDSIRNILLEEVQA
jgi:protein-tyrosine phosphatase